MAPINLIGKLSQLSLRGWVLMAGLLLALTPWRPNWLRAVDASLFQLSSFLVEAPKSSSNIGLVEVPPELFHAWQEDLHDAGQLAALVSNILHSSNSAVGVVFSAPPDARQGAVDAFLSELASAKGSAQQAATEMAQRKRFLIDLMNDSRVVVGVKTLPVALQQIPQETGLLKVLPASLINRLWPVSSSSAETEFLDFPGDARIPLRPFMGMRSTHWQLVSRSADSDAIYAGFLPYLLVAADRGVSTSAQNPWNLVWQRDRGMFVGDELITTSPKGRFLAYHAATRRMQPLLNRMSLEEGLARGAFPDFVLIAASGDPQVEQLAAALYSVRTGHIASTPWWEILLSPLSIILITLLMVLVIPRLTAVSGALVLALLGLFFLVSQQVLTVVQGIWLPVATQLIWMLLGYGFIRLWVNYRSAWNRLQHRADSACLVQVSGMLETGQLSEARELLDECSSTPDVLGKYYALGNAYSARRQYRSSLEVFQTVLERDKNFRDTEQKIKALEAMVATPEVPVLQPREVDATVVLNSADIEQPVLGRYEIREELGRGAMGIVYLGFDPKIARQVAIKTLNYSQFEPRQLDNIKSRFFREAEAAGRLAHPNIVSVYDVGEERDLAFIAMDYVEGKSLSSFIDPNCLLPVFEVYRIIADVAAALEYAHNSNIVHRDIKPGNIMYNPSPYQVKVTDFGIARLMDDSKTSTGEILGSPLYMSPEQLKGKRVNPAADVFSLGVTFYQLLSGYLPFTGDNLASLTYEIIHGKHKGVRTIRKDLPSSASRITNQCLQKAAEDRYESAGELALVLKKAIKRDFAHEARKVGYL